MPRSLKKGPFVDGHIYEKVSRAKDTGDRKIIKTWSQKIHHYCPNLSG